MADYNIVLNLSGNAVERAEKLALYLERANTAARSLATSLAAVGSASRNIPKENVKAVSSEAKAHQRHARAGIRSSGVGFSIGGYSTRWSMITDASPEFIPMLNTAGIVKSLAGSVIKLVGKAVIGSTAYSYGAGGLLTLVGAKILTSEGMAEAIRIRQRRRHAAMGLGENYAVAEGYANRLATEYGLERSTTISSLNVLSGLRIGSTGQKVNLGMAAGLSKVGGFIAQQAGVSFERVMTNIQQLLAQATPNVRDIRELIGQAPILGRYAIDEMERRGIQGVPVTEFYKNQANIIDAIGLIDEEISSDHVQLARRRVILAEQDFLFKLA